MNEERLYDYKADLNAPYWIQEIKTKRHSTGTLRRPCSCPFHLSLSSFCGHVTLWRGLSLCHSRITHSISLLLYWYLPSQIGQFILNTSLTVKDARLYRRLPELLLGF